MRTLAGVMARTLSSRVHTPSHPSNMPRTSCLLAAFAALIASAPLPLAAAPVTRQCDYKGEGKLGPLVVAYDEIARLVRVTTSDGRIWRYQDGAIGRLGPTLAAADDPGPVEQFVILSGPAKSRLASAGRMTARPATWPISTSRRSRTRRSAASGARFGTSRWGDARRSPCARDLLAVHRATAAAIA